MTKRTCDAVEDGTPCGKPVVARGWCSKHHKRWKRHGDPLTVLSSTPVTCSIDSCDQPVIARNWCTKHYQRWSRTGDPLGSTQKHAAETCSIEDCDNPRLARGWCQKHWRRWRKHGDPLARKTVRADPEARFWAFVNKNGSVPARRPELGPCWMWTGGTDKAGYGRFSVGKREARAARYIWELKVEPIPAGYEPDHLCRNTGCVNYESHLEVVTGRENTLRSDGVTAINARKTHCKNGHEFTPENTRVTQRPDGRSRRTCKTCALETCRRYQARMRAQREAAA